MRRMIGIGLGIVLGLAFYNITGLGKFIAPNDGQSDSLDLALSAICGIAAAAIFGYVGYRALWPVAITIIILASVPFSRTFLNLLGV